MNIVLQGTPSVAWRPESRLQGKGGARLNSFRNGAAPCGHQRTLPFIRRRLWTAVRLKQNVALFIREVDIHHKVFVYDSSHVPFQRHLEGTPLSIG